MIELNERSRKSRISVIIQIINFIKQIIFNLAFGMENGT